MKSRLVVLMPILSGIFFGSSGVFVRSLRGMGMHTMQLVESRAVLSVLFVGIIILLTDRKLFCIRKRDIWIFALGGIGAMFGLNLCLNQTYVLLSLSLATVLLCLSSVFTIAIAAVLFKESVTRRKVTCAAVAILGCVFVSGAAEQGIGSVSAIGVLFGLLSALFYALYGICSKSAVQREYHGLTTTFWCVTLLAIVLIPFTDWGELGRLTQTQPVQTVLLSCGNALFVSALPYALLTVSINYMDAGKAGVLASCEPAAAMVFGAIIYGEVPTVLNLVGMVLTLAAIGFLSLPEKGPQLPEKNE